MTDFNIEQALSLLNSDNVFIIDFEKAYVWIGYTTKGNAKRAFLNMGFVEGVDFIINDKATTTGISTIPLELISMTVECFKMWCMMAQTAKGRAVRMYFIEAEKQLKAISQKAEEVKQLSPWKSSRNLTKHTHNDFMNAAKAKHHPAAMVHDLITSLVTGYTAQEAREELKLIEGDKSVGLNYQPSDEHLGVIAEAKKLYTTYRKGTWQDQARRAVYHASPD